MPAASVFISEPVRGRIYVLELARRGSRKLCAYVMPEAPVAPDVPVALARVPVAIRRAARRQLIGDAR